VETKYLKNVPGNIKEEVKNLGLTIGSLWGGIDKPRGAVTTKFIQKENQDKIKKLKELGWEQERGCIVDGKRYISFFKFFNTSC